MSLILDALSRAEREKQTEEAPVPDLLAPMPERAPPGWMDRLIRAPWLKYAVLGAVALIAILGVFFRGDGETTDPQRRGTAPQSSVQTVQTVQTEQTQAQQRLKPSTSPVAIAPEAARVAASGVQPPNSAMTHPGETLSQPLIERPETNSASASVPIDTPARSVMEPELRVRQASIDALYAQEDVDERVQSDDSAVPASPRQAARAEQDGQEIDLAQVLAQLREQTKSEGLAPHPVPMLADLSKQFRDRVPTLMYSQHDYATQGRSTVLINGTALRVGQRTRRVEVREILPDSVILRFSETDFRLRALNSWVNL